MSEVMKDSAIKLFGKTITLLPETVVSDVSVSEQRQSSLATSTSHDSKESGGDFARSRHEYESINPTEETMIEAATSSEISDGTDTPSTRKKDEPSESNASQEKTLKKPEKILPCPRCNSMDTKFCYFNNYNVNQPRHFCKNCQRYWTSGGTMRNVPVGSGRRKSKNAVVPNFRHMIVSDSPFKASGFLIGPTGFPVSFYPATSYWESAAPSPWNVSPAMSTSPNSILGKHSREEATVRTSSSGKENVDAERFVLIPKMLRIHDPSEAAKSSIWSTLGIKNERSGSLSGACLFKAVESKGERGVDNTTMVLQANPAALSRSLNFHESA